MSRINVEEEAINQMILETKCFIDCEIEIIQNLKKYYLEIGGKWDDLQYLKFQNALHYNEATIKDTIAQAEQLVEKLKKGLRCIQNYLDTDLGCTDGNFVSNDISRDERALYELEVLRSDLELGTGDPNVPQLGGAYGTICGVIPGFEAHHIPSNAIQGASKNKLPAIALTANDHAMTDSYRGRQNRILKSLLYSGTETYREATANMIDSNEYIKLVRFELLNIRQICGHKYDGAISQYLDALKEYILLYGIPISNHNQ